MALLPGDVELFAKFSAGGAGEELTMVGFYRIEAVIVGNEAVEGAVGLEVGCVWISGGGTHKKLTEVSDGLP